MAPTNTSYTQFVDQIAGDNSPDGGRTTWADTSFTINITGLADPEMRAAVTLATQAWTAVAGFKFTFVTGAAEITIDDQEAGAAYNQTTVNSNMIITKAVMNVGRDWMDGFPEGERWGPGTYGVQTFIHELGHAFGLDHGGPYNGDGNYQDDAVFVMDTYQYSVMSYFPQPNYGAATELFLLTPMIADIAAINENYGARAVNAGDTVYGRSGLYDYTSNPDIGRTIYDTNGSADAIDLRLTTEASRVDLNAGSFSNIAGNIKNLAIAAGTVIERAYGGSAGDTLIGNAASNYLLGYGGADKFSGGSGNDLIEGGAGGDTMRGGAGADNFRYLKASEAAGDLIIDFTRNVDHVVLEAIDARASAAGNQAFTFIGTRAFTQGVQGQLRYAFSSGDTVISGDVNGDRVADFSIRLDGQIALSAGDFFL